MEEEWEEKTEKSVAEEDDEEGYDDEKSEHGRMGKRRGRRILQTMDTGTDYY